jgi:hypothetical protein
MANPIAQRGPYADRSWTRAKPKKSRAGAAAERYPPAQPQHAESREDAARKAVAVAFARIVTERYPGTSWLPAERSGSDDGLVVPAGKVLRLLAGPADVNAGGRIGHPAAPPAGEGAPYEYGADPGA